MAAGARQAAFRLAGTPDPVSRPSDAEHTVQPSHGWTKRALILSSAHVPSLQASYLVFRVVPSSSAIPAHFTPTQAATTPSDPLQRIATTALANRTQHRLTSCRCLWGLRRPAGGMWVCSARLCRRARQLPAACQGMGAGRRLRALPPCPAAYAAPAGGWEEARSMCCGEMVAADASCGRN